MFERFFILRDAVTDDTKRTRVIKHDEIRIQRGFAMSWTLSSAFIAGLASLSDQMNNEIIKM